MQTNISILFAFAFLVFILFDWYLEYTNVIMTEKFKNMETFACSLILEGFLIKSEENWGEMSDSIARKWMELDCTHTINCLRLQPLYRFHKRESVSSTFIGLWDSMRCNHIMEGTLPAYSKPDSLPPPEHMFDNLNTNITISERIKVTSSVSHVVNHDKDLSKLIPTINLSKVNSIGKLAEGIVSSNVSGYNRDNIEDKNNVMEPTNSSSSSSSSIPSLQKNMSNSSKIMQFINYLLSNPIIYSGKGKLRNKEIPRLQNPIVTLNSSISSHLNDPHQNTTDSFKILVKTPDKSQNNSIELSNNISSLNQSQVLLDHRSNPFQHQQVDRIEVRDKIQLNHATTFVLKNKSVDKSNDIISLNQSQGLFDHRSNPFQHQQVDRINVGDKIHLNHATTFVLKNDKPQYLQSDNMKNQNNLDQNSYSYTVLQNLPEINAEERNLYWCYGKRIENVYNNSLSYKENQVLWDKLNCENLLNVSDSLEAQREEVYIKQIRSIPNTSDEKRVISIGLYGNNTKYTIGAIKNVELSKIYFPDWVCRIYVGGGVPTEIVNTLKDLGAEIVQVAERSMFSRFLIADDPSVDRFIVRDADSRLNSRDRLAVEEWIASNYSLHSIRDHINHCFQINGGLWGGKKGSFPELTLGLKAKLNETSSVTFSSNNKRLLHQDHGYMDDIRWLTKLWNNIGSLNMNHRVYQHDSYCCLQFPESHPYPTKRKLNFQHIGQVFDDLDRPNITHIAKYLINKPSPIECRGNNVNWIYG